MNTIFKFKQFDIINNENVWKVGTDGVLLGALLNCENAENILDIGCGTGLIALMAAQKSNALIDAIDINDIACELTKQNIRNSKWGNRISVHNTAIQDFFPNKKYDLIVSNPPFFLTGQPAPNKNRAIARHTTELNFIELAENVTRLLNDNGIFAVIYPSKEMLIFEKFASQFDLHLKQSFFVHPNPQKEHIRTVSFFAKKITNFIKYEDITIETEKRHDYTAQYRNLTQDYYWNI